MPPGAVRVAGCQALRLRATRITGISGDDTVSVRKASGAAVTVTGPSALTGVVEHRAGHRPTARDRHARDE